MTRPSHNGKDHPKTEVFLRGGDRTTMGVLLSQLGADYGERAFQKSLISDSSPADAIIDYCHPARLPNIDRAEPQHYCRKE